MAATQLRQPSFVTEVFGALDIAGLPAILPADGPSRSRTVKRREIRAELVAVGAEEGLK